MKKQFLIFLLLFPFLFLPSCNNKKTNASIVLNDTSSRTNNTSDTLDGTNSMPSIPPSPVTAEHVKLYGYVWNTTTPILDEAMPSWNNELYKDSNAILTRATVFLGTSTIANYSHTSKYAMTDLCTDSYDSESFSIRFKSGTDEITGIYDFFYEHQAQTKEEYLSEVAKILGADYSIQKEYQCLIRTVFRTFEQEKSTLRAVDDFYIPSEGEILKERHFIYYHCINGIKTKEQYYVEFEESDQTITVWWHDFGYTTETFASRQTMNMEEIIHQYLINHKNPNMEDFGNYTLDETMAVTKGKPYSIVTVTFDSKDKIDLIVPHTID